jgi:hypothetical protein
MDERAGATGGPCIDLGGHRQASDDRLRAGLRVQRVAGLGKAVFRLEDSSIGIYEIATHTVTMIAGGETIPGLDIPLAEAFD